LKLDIQKEIVRAMCSSTFGLGGYE
jgi:hypothetical protein